MLPKDVELYVRMPHREDQLRLFGKHASAIKFWEMLNCSLPILTDCETLAVLLAVLHQFAT